MTKENDMDVYRATEEAYKNGFEAGRAQGYDAGFADGKAEGRARYADALVEWANRCIAEYETDDDLYSEDEETRIRAAAQVAVLQGVKAHVRAKENGDENNA